MNKANKIVIFKVEYRVSVFGFFCNRKPLAERVDKKFRTMDKKYSYGKMKATGNLKKSKIHRR